MNVTESKKSGTSLNRALTLFPTTAIVIGAVVGSGIFVSSAGMARSLNSAPLLFLVWAAAGAMTFIGSLTQSELVGQMPKTGGLYTFLKEVYGETVGFLYGWANFMIAGSGAIAAIAFIFASYVGEFFPLPHLSPELEKIPVNLPLVGQIFPFADIGKKMVGGVLVAFLTFLNIRGVKLGALVQSISTTTKMLAIGFIVALAFFAGGDVGNFANFTGVTGTPLSGWALAGAITMALSGAFWSYDGWGNVAYISGEVKDPARTVPRALVLGTLSFIVLYLVVNAAYIYILPIGKLGAVPDDRVASTMASAVVGNWGAWLVAGIIILSTFDTVNATILTNARVYFAMSEQRVFWKSASSIHPQYQTPHRALLYQGMWSLVLLFSGSFDSVASMYVFVNWVLYVLMALALFILRVKFPRAERPFKTPGYPWVPGLFLVFSLLYVVLTLVTDVQAYHAGQQPLIKSGAGLLLVATGLPFYLFWRRNRR